MRLRGWRPSDRAPFAAMNADARVMEFLPKPLARAESDAVVAGIEAHFARHGFGWWALERRDDSAFLGFCGLRVTPFEAAFTPCVEIGWRLAPGAWGGWPCRRSRARLSGLRFRDARAG